MKNDPIYLFQVLPQKASLGVLLVAGNVYMMILSEKWKYVKMKLAFVLECLGDFTALCEVEYVIPKSLNKILKVVTDEYI